MFGMHEKGNYMGKLWEVGEVCGKRGYVLECGGAERKK